ncbi:MAG: hypothetical protein ACF8R7_03520, partial [Phycisphaerales bacterium JB039]
MKRTRAIALALGAIGATVPGAPTCALAQSGAGLFFEAPDVLSPAQPSITVRLWAEFPAADYALAGAGFDVHASEPGWSDPVDVLHVPFGGPGIVMGADVVDVAVAQWHFPGGAGYFADPGNPIEVWRAKFTITDFASRTISFSTDTEYFGVFPWKKSPVSELRTSHEAFHEVRVIPAPGALGPGGLVGIAAVGARRRRGKCPCHRGLLLRRRRAP